MRIADRLKEKYISRIDELIASGAALPMRQHSRQTGSNFLSGESTYQHYNLASWAEFVEWRTSCTAVLDQCVPKGSLLRQTVDHFPRLGNKPSEVEFAVAFLKSVTHELNSGMLDSFAQKIEAETLSDYLDQATSLLRGGDHAHNLIAAAVISGAALERTLRSICGSLVPPEPVLNDKGMRLQLNALIDSLKRRDVFNELMAKHLRAWASIRNSAAHGDFEALTRQQVEAMVAGVVGFVAEHVK
jgi:hypothetical protein